MNRPELLRRFVLNEVADDYENLEKIYSEVSSLGSRCGLSLPRGEIKQALVDLIEARLVKAYRLTTNSVEEFDGVPEAERMDDSYFWITPRGKDLLVSDGDWWPFDDEGSLRVGWVPPAE